MKTSVSFAPFKNYSVGSSSYASAVGDFNKDSFLDVAFIAQNGLYVNLGNSSGSFGSAQFYSVGYTGNSFFVGDVVIGDFNKDGFLDLATGNGDSLSVSVLLNNRSGDFNPATTFSIENPADNLKVGDFDGDGYDDIASANAYDGIVSVLRNNRSGSFETYRKINIPTLAADAAAVGDFNKDGILDLATPDGTGNTISVQFGDDSGNFGHPNKYDVGIFPTSVAVGDFNGDGILDLASANFDGDTISVLLGDGNGGFGIATDYSVGSEPYYVKVGDFNNDGIDDISTVNQSGTVLNQSGSGSILFQKYLTNSQNDIFQLNGDKATKLKIKFQIKGHSSKLIDELGVFNVDDSQGTIEGIAPGTAGYQEKALERAKTIFSVLFNNPNGFNPNNLTRILEFNGGTQLRFYLRTNTTIIFSNTTNQQINSFSTGGFSIGWNDGSRSESVFDDLVIKFQETGDELPIGTNLQGQSQGEAIDLREFASDSLIGGTFTVNREAAYNDYVGFYKVTDVNGGIDIDGDGNADILPGQAGYVQAAINSRVAGIGLSVANQGSATSQGNFTGGAIYVPFLIVNGGVDALLDNNSKNDPVVYFTFLGANSDKTQHVKILADNVFGFEDLAGGGDRDYNDVIVKVNLTGNLA